MAFNEAKAAKGILRYTPRVEDKTLLIICILLNIFIPGAGTLIGGFKCERTDIMIIGILQLILSCVWIGWVWSVIWAFLIYKRSTGLLGKVPMTKI